MCGINGIYAYNVAAGQPDRAELIATRDAMIARGPDGAGEYWSADGRLGLGHRRLAILDLSDRGAQPMASASGRYRVVFNGEIYNFPDLRRGLEEQGIGFGSRSDTEVLLYLYERHGERMVEHLRGMYAFSIWDETAQTLFLARDPYGIKPLYVADDGWTFRFASQVKALLAGGRIPREAEPAGVVGFHLWGSVPEPFTLYRGIRALPAGHTQLVDRGGPHPPRPFASVSGLLGQGAGQVLPSGDPADLLRPALLDSVRAHLLADVEVGLFLSSGIDSGAILGLMRDAGQEKITAITLAFDEFRGTGDDETSGAAEMAARYGARHVMRHVDEAEFHGDLPAILAAMDQPTIDGINTWFIAKAAREAGLKVALSGVGGDELLAGYPSFTDIPRWAALLRLPSAVPGLPTLFRSAVAALAPTRMPPKAAGLLHYGGSWHGAFFLRRALLLPFELDEVLDPDTIAEGLRRLDPLGQVAAADPVRSGSASTRIAAMESSFYLRNQLLRDVDWAGMAHSIEIRTPLVDSELLRRVAPLTARFSGRAGKLALARSPSLPLPDRLMQKSKTGFSIPSSTWLMAGKDQARQSRSLVSREWARTIMAGWDR